MADKYEKDLSNPATVDKDVDYIRMVGGDDVSYKATFAQVAPEMAEAMDMCSADEMTALETELGL